MAPAFSLVEEKRALRRVMRERRAALGTEERAERAQAATRNLGALPELAAARAVAGFVATQAELDPAQALAEAGRRGAAVAFPRVTTGQPRLRFHRIAGPADLLPGAYGILEPQPACPEVPAEELDVILMPGLAFDGEGHRLGYGGGYYDEVAGLVRRKGRALLVGLGFDFQLVDRCPAGEADVNIDRVVTDARVVRCRAKGSESSP
jgi:5-formyltetrahydrofolate cyclo-ligase